MSTSLAVRHRPTTWETVAGQRHLVTVLRAAAARRPVPQQVLLAGPSGVGKTTLARIFAAALFCTQAPDGEACGQCQSCRDVTGPGGRHVDVIEIDAASHGGVEQIRALADAAHMAPLIAPWRVYIIDEAHGLTASGAQAFLKTLEEPPSHTVIVLATTDPQKLPDALRGRCLLCYATDPTREEKVENLVRVGAAEGWPVTRELVELVVDSSDPRLGVRGTVTALDKVAGSGTVVDLAEAATLLGVADPRLLSEMTAHIDAGRTADALTLLDDVCAATPRTLVHTRLLAHAEQRLRDGIETGDPTVGLTWMDVLSDTPARHLELAVARLCGFQPSATLPPPPPPAGTVATSHTASPVPAAPAAPAPTPAPAPVTPAPQPPDETALAEATAASEVDVDGEMRAWLNTTAAQDARTALCLKRCTVSWVSGTWVVTDRPDNMSDTMLELATSTAGRPVEWR